MYRQNHQGFTMLELLITMVIVAIVTGIAAPSFQSMIARNKVNSFRDSLFNALQYARSEALVRKNNVGVCASTNMSNCMAGTNWAGGWIVYLDSNNDGSIKEAGDLILQKHYTNAAATSSLVMGAVSQNLEVFTPLGRVAVNNQVQIIGLCDPHTAAHGKAVAVTISGAIQRKGSVDASCP